jgi:2-oxoglutarate dehydrogenase E2 component (dihydrolipoamide succinyltransferase)
MNIEEKLPAAPKPSPKKSPVSKPQVPEPAPPPLATPAVPAANSREVRKKLSPLRRKTAARLVKAQQTAAILTTFNECDMGAVIQLRKDLQDVFLQKFGVKLGFMSFFIKAVVDSLQAVPAINSRIDGDDLILNNTFDIGVAVGTGRGLIVPVLRGCEKLSFAEIENQIVHYAAKAREGKVSLDDLEGGVFTISNGGIYGSLLSTQILNPPQSGILGIHKIQERAVVVNGRIFARPMMYLALSYDHRFVDGKEAVTFLLRVKDCIENPARLLLDA